MRPADYTQHLYRPDAGADQGPARARRELLDRRLRRTDQFRHSRSGPSRTGPSATARKSRSSRTCRGGCRRWRASRPSSSLRRRCPAPAAACRSRWSSSRPAIRARSSRWRRRSGIKAQASGKFIIVQNSLAYDAQQVTITVDRDRAAALNLPVRDIGTTLGLLVGGGRWRSSTATRTATTSSCRCRSTTGRTRSSSAISSCGASPARWCRFPPWSVSRPTSPPPRSSSSTSSTRRPSRRCRSPA